MQAFNKRSNAKPMIHEIRSKEQLLSANLQRLGTAKSFAQDNISLQSATKKSTPGAAMAIPNQNEVQKVGREGFDV